MPAWPMALLFCSASIITTAFLSSIFTLMMRAGLSARATKIAGSALYSIASMFSPFNSLLTAFILTPFTPTAVPTASTFGLVEKNATFAFLPGILALFWIITLPSFISGTPAFKRASKNLGEVRVSSILIPKRLSKCTLRMSAFMVSPTLNFSSFMRFLRLISVFVSPISTKVVSSFPTLVTTPITKLPIRAVYFSYTLSSISLPMWYSISFERAAAAVRP